MNGFSLFAIVIGTWLTYVCRRELALAWQSLRWPVTEGRITGTTVHDGVTMGLATDGTNAPTMQDFRMTEWIYSYEVAGQSYSSSRYSFSVAGWRENERYLEEGDEVRVYYCASDPTVAVLRRGPNAGLMTGPAVLVFGIIVLLVGMALT